jgi:hypothetical protein
MTSKLRVDEGVSVFRGEPLSTATVNRTVARVRWERDRNNLGGYVLKLSKSAKRPGARKTSVKETTP